MSAEAVGSFKESWLAASDGSFSSRMARQSLEVLASDVHEYDTALTELKQPLQEQLDLHLEGGSVKNHAAPAASLGDFYRAVSDAVKEISKSITGAQRGASQLLAFAPIAGSVRVVLQAPAPEEVALPFEALDFGTPDARALRTVAQLLATAESGASTLDAGTRQLSRKSRSALRRLGETVIGSSWTIRGTLVARNREPIVISFSPTGAGRLVAATRVTDEQVTEVEIHGDLDGWTWSTGTLRFIPRTGRPFSASVPANLQPRIARLNAEKATGVRAIFVRTSRVPVGTNRASNTSFALSRLTDLDGHS